MLPVCIYSFTGRVEMLSKITHWNANTSLCLGELTVMASLNPNISPLHISLTNPMDSAPWNYFLEKIDCQKCQIDIKQARKSDEMHYLFVDNFIFSHFLNIKFAPTGICKNKTMYLQSNIFLWDDMSSRRECHIFIQNDVFSCFFVRKCFLFTR